MDMHERISTMALNIFVKMQSKVISLPFISED